MNWQEKRCHPLYRRWTHARTVVSNPRSPDYKPNLDMDYYDDFELFVSMIEQECGPRPSDKHLLCRRDPKKGYVHGNLEWCIRTELSHKLPTTILIEYQGKQVDLKTLSKIVGIKYSTLRERYNRGWHLDDLLTIRPNLQNRILRTYAKT